MRVAPPLQAFVWALSEDAQGRAADPEEVSNTIWEFKTVYKGRTLLVTVEDVTDE